MVEREVVGRFIDAAVEDHELAQELLDVHPDLRHANWLNEEHLLHFLVIENFEAGVIFCLQRGFDPNQPDPDTGSTLLHNACKLGYLGMAKILLKTGADPNAVSIIDDTPLHCAVRNGSAELVDCLIEHGADTNYATDLGETIFDNWPPWAEPELSAVMARRRVKRPNGGASKE